MNCDTGHLVRELEMVEADARAEYKRVPKRLAAQAESELNGEPEVMVDLKKKTPLTNWANRTRNQRKRDRKKGL